MSKANFRDQACLEWPTARPSARISNISSTYLEQRNLFEEGNAANGIDFPGIGVDMKVTSIPQPQSSCPYKSARQKFYGLGYGLIVCVYGKADDEQTRTAVLRM